MIHLWKKIVSNFNSMSKLEYSEWQNEEFYKLAKMSVTEIREYVYNKYPRSKANFFMKYKLPQYRIFLPSFKETNTIWKK